MINEASIYKSLIDKDFVKAKYLLSKFLKKLYSILAKERDRLGALNKFTLLTDAIFFMLNDMPNYTTWFDYRSMLENSFKETSNFPKYLTAYIKDLIVYNQTCPIVAKHSNETLLLAIVEKLLVVCCKDVEGMNDGMMDVDSNQNVNLEEANHQYERILLVLGQSMVNYGTIQNLPDTENVKTSAFLALVNQFSTGLNFNVEVLKRICVMIPQDYSVFNESLSHCENVIAKFLTTFGIKSLQEMYTVLNSIVSGYNVGNLTSLAEFIKNTTEQLKAIQDSESLNELSSNIGNIVIQQFHSYNVEYNSPNPNKYEVYVSAIQELARSYVLSKVSDFCSPQKDDVCKINEQVFVSRLQEYVSFYSNQSSLAELSVFKKEILKLIFGNSENQPNPVQSGISTLQSFILLYGQQESIATIYQSSKILFESFGENVTITTIISSIESFISLQQSDDGTKKTFFQAVTTVKNIVKIVGASNKSLTDCEIILKSLIAECNGVDTVDKIYRALSDVKQVYKNRLPDEQFSIVKLSKDLESFLDSNETGEYFYIPGETNNIKLEFVHTHLTKQLHEMGPAVKYDDVISFFRNIGLTAFDKSALDTFVQTLKDSKNVYTDSLRINNELKEARVNLQSCRESLKNAEVIQGTLEGEKKELLSKYEETLKEKNKGKLKNDQLQEKLDNLQKTMEELQNEHKTLQDVYANTHRAYEELIDAGSKKVAYVSGKKRKLSSEQDRVAPDGDEMK